MSLARGKRHPHAPEVDATGEEGLQLTLPPPQGLAEVAGVDHGLGGRVNGINVHVCPVGERLFV